MREGYFAVVFLFDVGEEGWVAEVCFSAGADVASLKGEDFVVAATGFSLLTGHFEWKLYVGIRWTLLILSRNCKIIRGWIRGKM